MCLGDRLPSIDSVSLSCLALGAVAALLTERAPAAELPRLVHPASATAALPFADVRSDAPAGTGQRVVLANGAQEDFFGWSVDRKSVV